MTNCVQTLSPLRAWVLIFRETRRPNLRAATCRPVACGRKLAAGIVLLATSSQGGLIQRDSKAEAHRHRGA